MRVAVAVAVGLAAFAAGPTAATASPFQDPLGVSQFSVTGANGVAGDEFDGSALDTSVWRVLDPVGDSSVSVASGQLRLGVPAGVSHDLWTGALRAPRVLRAAADGDFEIEAKFDVATTQAIQSQGLVAQADDNDFVRFDVHSTSSATKVFAATFVDGQATSRVNKTIAGGAPLRLRMQRVGSRWTLLYAVGVGSWVTATSFDFALALSEFGMFALNWGSPPPAFTAQIDYFRVGPQVPAPDPADVTAPVISGVGASAGARSATVSWSTDEPADSRVEYGTSSGYGSVGADAALVSAHSVQLSGLACATTYHYRVSSADAAGNRATSGNQTFTTGACPTGDGPDIEIWHGDSLRFGALGFPQRWLNVLGRADDPDGLSSIRYQLNGGTPKALVFDPAENPRIVAYGDFNVQLDRLALTAGTHLVTILATDGAGDQSSRVVEIEVDPPKSWPLPYETDWTSGLLANAQVVDGKWAVEGDGARALQRGYDRTLAIGSETWAGLDVTVRVTIHSLDLTHRNSAVGVATGWRGHEGASDDEPWLGWPLGGLCFYYRPSATSGHELFLLRYGASGFKTADRRKDWIALGTPHLFRISASPIDAQNSRYSCKVWAASDPEPADWQISEIMPRRDGSVLLVAHYADVTFGRVVVNGN